MNSSHIGLQADLVNNALVIDEINGEYYCNQGHAMQEEAAVSQYGKFRGPSDMRPTARSLALIQNSLSILVECRQLLHCLAVNATICAGNPFHNKGILGKFIVQAIVQALRLP